MTMRPDRWALPPVAISDYHSKSAAYADGFDQGWQAAIEKMRALADARDDYRDEAIESETHAVRLVSDILADQNDAAGWLPSWRWEEFGVSLSVDAGDDDE